MVIFSQNPLCSFGSVCNHCTRLVPPLQAAVLALASKMHGTSLVYGNYIRFAHNCSQQSFVCCGIWIRQGQIQWSAMFVQESRVFLQELDTWELLHKPQTVELFTMNIWACGTENRKDCPHSASSALKKQPPEVPSGGHTMGQLCWLLHTQTLAVPWPTPVLEFNKHMGGYQTSWSISAISTTRCQGHQTKRCFITLWTCQRQTATSTRSLPWRAASSHSPVPIAIKTDPAEKKASYGMRGQAGPAGQTMEVAVCLILKTHQQMVMMDI